MVAGCYLIGTAPRCMVSRQKGRSCFPHRSCEPRWAGWGRLGDRRNMVSSIAPTVLPRIRYFCKSTRRKQSPVLDALSLREGWACMPVNKQIAVLNKLIALTTHSAMRWLPTTASLLGSACTRAEPGLALLHQPYVKSLLHFHRAAKIVIYVSEMVLFSFWRVQYFWLPENLYLPCSPDETK